MKHLVIGADSVFGQAVVASLTAAGERVVGFEGDWRDVDEVARAGDGAASVTIALDLPMARWNPDWQRVVENVCAAVETTGATVLMPTNVYGFKLIYDVPLPAEPPPADVNDRPCEPGRVRDAVESTLAQLAELNGNRVILVRAVDALGGAAWPWSAMHAARQAGAALPWPDHEAARHAFVWAGDLGRLAVRALLGAPKVRPLPTESERDDPDWMPPTALEVYALHGELFDGPGLAAAVGMSGVRRLSHTLLRVHGLWSAEAQAIVEVLPTWEGAVFLDERASRRWLPDFETVGIAEGFRR